MTREEAEIMLNNYQKKGAKIIVEDFICETKRFFAFSCKHKGCDSRNFTYVVLKHSGDVVLAPMD